MRRQLRDELPLLMRIYPGLKPWELDLFTLGELKNLMSHAQTLVGPPEVR